MKPSAVPETLCSQLSEFIAEKMGLHFPSERWGDLKRGLAGAAGEFGFADVAACARWLLSASLTQAQVQTLASHLTVGETYFFREKKTFDVLAESVLPELIGARRNREPRLRIWSAACCTGEEPYSLAMLLHQVIPDLQNWHVTILATDINERFLQKAVTGVYGEWSFRDVPAWIKGRFFQRTREGRYSILPEIRKHVTFAHLNLVEEVYDSLATDRNAMDVIFCRNVLMYFTLPQARRVVRNLRRSLVEEGWLAVSPSEGSQTLFSGFVPVNFPGVALYQKSDAKARTGQSWTPPHFGESATFVAPAAEAPLPWMPPTGAVLSLESVSASPTEEPAQPQARPTPCAVAASLHQQGRYAEVVSMLLNSLTARDAPNPTAFSLLARALANQGKLTDALVWCDRWVAADKLEASGHYLRAVILQELGDNEQARCSLQSVIYLQPGFVLAHFALGNLARNHGKVDEAVKHFINALHLLRGCQTNEVLPESEGLTAGRLSEIISSILALETAP